MTKSEGQLQANARAILAELAIPVHNMVVVNSKIENIVANQKPPGLAMNISTGETMALEGVNATLLFELLQEKGKIFKQIVETLNIENIKMEVK